MAKEEISNGYADEGSTSFQFAQKTVVANMIKSILRISVFLLAVIPVTIIAQEVEYRAITADALRESPAGSAIAFKILVDSANLGSSETRIAELTFASGYSGPPHLHDAIEIFYVISGRFGHSVNDQPGVLEAGDIGIVRPGDTVAHSVLGNEPAVVLTIWLPGGEAAPFHSP